ncbi:hypothetical protein HEP84_57885 [Streptomyces sp. RLB1-33]
MHPDIIETPRAYDHAYSIGAEFVADGGYLLGPVPAAKPRLSGLAP